VVLQALVARRSLKWGRIRRISVAINIIISAIDIRRVRIGVIMVKVVIITHLLMHSIGRLVVVVVHVANISIHRISDLILIRVLIAIIRSICVVIMSTCSHSSARIIKVIHMMTSVKLIAAITIVSHIVIGKLGNIC